MRDAGPHIPPRRLGVDPLERARELFLHTEGHRVRQELIEQLRMPEDDAFQVLAFDAQFRKPVWPGDTLVTAGWHLGDGLYALKVTVKERDESVLTNAWARVAK